jgi:hypothetical protein
MVNSKLPNCAFCINGQWVEHGIVNEKTGKHLYSCGGGVMGTPSENRKPGCGRVVLATPEEMSAGRVI